MRCSGTNVSTSQRACQGAGPLGEIQASKSSLILDFQGQESKPLLGSHYYSITVGIKPLFIFQHRAECIVETSGVHSSSWRLRMTANYQTTSYHLLIGTLLWSQYWIKWHYFN